MKTTILKLSVFLGLFLSVKGHVSFARDREPLPPMTAEVAQEKQAKYGITLIEKNAQYSKYQLTDSGNFLVSAQMFANSLEAKKFCESVPGYRLTDGFFHSALIMMGLPIAELYNTAVVNRSVLSKNGGRTGVAYWFWPDMAKIPKKESMSELEREVLRSIEKGDIFAADLDGMEGDGSGIQYLSVINDRLAQLQLRPLSLHAVCEDEKLVKALHN